MSKVVEEKQDKPFLIELNEQSQEHINNILDKVLSQMLLDSKEHNDDSLKILNRPVFQSKGIDQLDIDDLLVLKLAYQRKQ